MVANMVKRIRPHWAQDYKLRIKELEAEIEAMHEMKHVRVLLKNLLRISEFY